MTPLLPTASEAASLRFLLPKGSVRSRLLVSGSLFVVGLAAWCLGSLPGSLAGLGLLLAGHLPLWVRTQTTAPGGATPAHEEVWAPAEDDWLDRVTDLERRGERWDTTPWDLSNRVGCLTLAGALLLFAATSFLAGVLSGGDVLLKLAIAGPLLLFATTSFLAGALSGGDVLLRLAVAGPLLFVPLWLNGLRTTWNPSELRKKGEALAVARAALEEIGGKDFDLVPLLALREGRRGKYPVDARLMARPASDDASGFLGVQVQVAMNNVRGTDFPYLYAVVLGKGGFRFPEGPRRQREEGVDLVVEAGESEGVVYRVVRQHADRSGGWHTEPHHIRGLVAAAVRRAREARQANGGPAA